MTIRWMTCALCAMAVGCGDDAVAPDASIDAPPPIDAAAIDSAPPDAGPSGIGMPCTATNPLDQGTCPSGELCATDAIGFPGGLCTARCDTTPCPSDAVCAPFGTDHYCAVPCSRTD